MSAQYMPTPCGPVPIREHVRKKMAVMSDREIADQALGGAFIDPEYYAELLHRGLSGPGMHKEDTYKLIEQREQALKE